MYSINKKNKMFYSELVDALREFVETGNHNLLLERIEFYETNEKLIKQLNEKYLIRVLESENDVINFEVSLNSFL